MEKKRNDRHIILSIPSLRANEIFEETKGYEFIKFPFRECDLNKKVYIFSTKRDKAIIGYVKVSKTISGNIGQILGSTGYDVRADYKKVLDYFKYKDGMCYALKLYDVTEFDEYLTAKDMLKVDPNINLQQYRFYIYEDQPLYNVIKEWDEAFSLDGNLCKNPEEQKKKILQRVNNNKMI